MQINTRSTRGSFAARGKRRERIVGLELDHGPGDHAERARDPLGELELSEQERIDAFGGLVVGVELVSKRLDHVIERDGDVRDFAAREPGGEASQQPARRPDLLAGGARVEGTAK